MNAIEKRYGTVLRCYDNGGKTCDRYTIIPPRWAKDYHERGALFCAIASDANPFHPQGFGQCVSAVPGPHLGKRIRWDELPEDVQKFARQSFPEYAPRAMVNIRVEHTDTFAGEANYSWVHRTTFAVAETARDCDVIRQAKAALGISGRHRKVDLGDSVAIYPAGLCQVIFIIWEPIA